MTSAILTRTTDFVIPTTRTVIPWDAADESGGTFFSAGNNTRITVPAGVSLLEIMFCGYAEQDIVTTIDIEWVLYKNGSELYQHITDENFRAAFGGSFGVLSVSEGDYFEIYVHSFSTAAKTLDFEYMAFSCATPDREGISSFGLSANLPVASDTVISGLTADSDDLSTLSGGNLVTVPEGVSHALVSLNNTQTTFDSRAGSFQLRKNGTVIRKYLNSESFWSPGPPCFGVIPVTAGDELDVLYTSFETFDASLFNLGIEWLS